MIVLSIPHFSRRPLKNQLSTKDKLTRRGITRLNYEPKVYRSIGEST